MKQLQFPEKQFFRNRGSKTVAQRRTVFEEYLGQLINLRPRPAEVNEFLDVAAHAAQIADDAGAETGAILLKCYFQALTL